jgi:hypothetical protein
MAKIYQERARNGENLPGANSKWRKFTWSELEKAKIYLERSLLVGLELARLLVQDVRVELEVDVLDALQVDAANLGGGAGLLDELLRLLQNGDNARLVLQALHVLVAVRVARLQHLEHTRTMLSFTMI